MNINLKAHLADEELSRKEKVLLILLHHDAEVPVKVISETAITNGLREAKKWNVSQILAGLKGMAIKLPDGWAITAKGKQSLAGLGVLADTPTQSVKPTLRSYASDISSDHVKQFVEEAINALETGLLRSAVVLSWVGAVSILYQEIIDKHLAKFNAEAAKRFPKWKNASNPDGLSKMKEYDFLQVLCGISIIGKNVKDELEQCLRLRNSCGHPNSLRIGEHKVASHIEILILNVYSKFSI